MHKRFSAIPAKPLIATIDDDSLIKIASRILGSPIDAISQVGTSGNSEIHKVIHKEQNYALKKYPLGGLESRNRLKVEQQALVFFSTLNIKAVPTFVGHNSGCSVFLWIDGSPANPPTMSDINAAISFTRSLHVCSRAAESTSIPLAYGHCMSGVQLCQDIDRRILELHYAAPAEQNLEIFLSGEIKSAYLKARSFAESHYRLHRLDFSEPIKKNQQSLIHGDFSLHNALRQDRGEVTFIDFEYFGWDDPVKMALDFLLHPAMLLPKHMSDHFEKKMINEFSDDTEFIVRFEALRGLFVLRWTLIQLNIFKREISKRVHLAQGEYLLNYEVEANRMYQLAKAQAFLKLNWG